METGTGKTCCYIKSMFELNKRFGWSKFIVVVPSIAIRESVYKSPTITSLYCTPLKERNAEALFDEHGGSFTIFTMERFGQLLRRAGTSKEWH